MSDKLKALEAEMKRNWEEGKKQREMDRICLKAQYNLKNKQPYFDYPK